MKERILTALILDSNPEHTKQIYTAVKEVFTSVHLEKDREVFEAEITRIKPNVIFMNLSIQQRAQNLNILDGLAFPEDAQPVIFGYNEGLEPELTAHALEVGLQDIFIKPFETELIASKVNQYFKFDKAMDKALHHTKLSAPLKGTVSLQLKFLGVDENGISFKSLHYINKGTVLKINFPLIKEIFSVGSIDMMVTKTWTDENLKENLLFLEPWNSSEQMNAALRRFILKKVESQDT